jgi:hypothetical protein
MTTTTIVFSRFVSRFGVNEQKIIKKQKSFFYDTLHNEINERRMLSGAISFIAINQLNLWQKENHACIRKQRSSEAILSPRLLNDFLLLIKFKVFTVKFIQTVNVTGIVHEPTIES